MRKPLVEPAQFFVLRTPLLPHDDLTSWSDGLRGPDAFADHRLLTTALADDRRLLRERLMAIVKRPEVREALFLASPSLEESLPSWIEQPESRRGLKVERSLVRYFLRMTSRPTPFGLFAGYSVGKLAPRTELRLDGIERYRRQARLDSGYLSILTEALHQRPVVRRALTYRLNTSLYRVGGRIRYVEARTTDRGRGYRLVAAEINEALEVIMARAVGGATFADLVDALVSAFVDDHVSREEADQFVDELVAGQILVSDLEPRVTGSDPLRGLIGQLAAIPAAVSVAAQLEATHAELERLAACPLGIPPASYRSVAETLKTLPAEPELARLFQVDMIKPVALAALGEAPVAEIVRATTILQRWSRHSRRDRFGRFREAFASRYEEREVPLTEVLDEDSGIGFERSTAPAAEATPLLEGIGFAPAPSEDVEPVGPHFRCLFAKLEAALDAGAVEIVLDDADVEEMADGTGDDELPPLPDTLAATVTLAVPSEDAAAGGDFRIWLHFVGGPSGANLLGRFCGRDDELERQVRHYLQQEEGRRPDAIFAEIVHLPEGRIGNVILRPVLRDWEIVFLGRSGAPHDRQITLDDLLVSVRGGRVVLRSRRLGREVIPRLTTAHNFDNVRNLGAYRFLCALQSQDTQSLRFSWGALEVATFLPRVRTGRTILSLARWRISGDSLEALKNGNGDERFAAAQRLRARYRLPRWVVLVDEDNLLPIDLDNILAVETFVQLIQNRTHVHLTERFDTDGLCARGPEGRFTHEIVLPLITVRGRVMVAPLITQTSGGAPRRFPPGSEWLYAKLYTGTSSGDEVLRDTIASVVSSARESGAVDSWFFTRYADPEFHIRVRFHGEPRRLTSEVLPLVQAGAAKAMAQGTIWRFQFDTYEREVERYGGDKAIYLSEQLFWADSDAVLGIVQSLASDRGADARWRLGLRGMDQFLDDFGFTLDEKQELLHRCRKRFGREFRSKGLLDRQLGERFRKERLTLEALLDRKQDGKSELEAGLALLDRRSERLRRIAGQLSDLRLCLPWHDVATSWLHMYANRLLRGAARAQELVLYDFLERLYEGQMARRR